MSSFDPNNVLDESWLLFFLTGLFGLRISRPANRRWLSYLWAIILAVLYSASFFSIRETMWRHYDSKKEVIYYFEKQKFESLFNIVTVPAIIFFSILKSYDNLRAYKKLDDIDRVLSYLNTQIDHDIEMRKEVVVLLSYLLITFLINLITYLSLVTADCGYIFNISSLLNFIPLFLEIITLAGFDLFVRKIRVRFEQINRVIGDLLGPKKISVILVHSADINNASKLRLARRIHLELHDAASAINKVYGLRLFLIFSVTLFSVLNNLRKSVNLIENQMAMLDLILYFMWTLFHVGKYFYPASSCRAASAEAKVAGEFFYEASLGQGSGALGEEAKALSQQLMNRKLKFDIYSTFSIDFSKGLTIFIGVFTYFLLLA